MALARCPARQGQQRSLRKMRQDLSWALARSPGARSQMQIPGVTFGGKWQENLRRYLAEMTNPNP